MLNKDGINVDHAQVAEYSGPIRKRAAWNYESKMEEIAHTGLTHLIERCIAGAKERGFNEVVFIDIGSDHNGIAGKTIAPDFLLDLDKTELDPPLDDMSVSWVKNTWGKKVEHMYRELAAKKIRLRYIGITDASTQGEFDTPIWDIEDDRFHGTNVAFTITRAQQLKLLLNHHLKPDQPIDVAVGMNVFQYITPMSFEEIVNNVLERLSWDGCFMGYDIRPRYFVGRRGINDNFRNEFDRYYTSSVTRRMAFLRGLNNQYNVRLTDFDGDSINDSTRVPQCFAITQKKTFVPKISSLFSAKEKR